jgi:transposase
VAFAIEGAGAYGAGLARFLSAAGCHVAEINRPDRRAHGKSDPLDAAAAARAVLAGGVAGVAKANNDHVGMIRNLRVACRSALKMRTQVINQMKALVITAPDAIRRILQRGEVSRLSVPVSGSIPE